MTKANTEYFEAIMFGKKSFSDLLKDIYDTNKRTEAQISDLISSLKPFIKTASDAIMIVPLIKEYLEVKVKNDEHLVKMAAVVQRAVMASQKAGSSDIILSDNEKEQLLLEINSMGDIQTIRTTTVKQTEKILAKNV